MLIYFSFSLFFYLTYYGLDEYAGDYFPETTAIVTKKYRICNTVKSGALAVLCIPGTQYLYNLAFYPELVTAYSLNLIGSVDASTDAAALIYNPNCHTSTLVLSTKSLDMIIYRGFFIAIIDALVSKFSQSDCR